MTLDFLEQHGFQVLHAPDGHAGAAMTRECRPVAVVLEVGAGATALSVLPALHPEKVPVIVVAPAEKADPVMMLELGADDFMTKPAALIELAARLRAAIRRTASHGHRRTPVSQT